MMHCTMEDLGGLRAGEASVWARRHITTCAQCQAELELLYQRVAQLKALPALRPPRDRWPVVKAAFLLMRPTATNTAYAELSQAKQQSATLEDSLKQVDTDGRVLSGHAAAAVADLEDRISVLDGTLAQRAENAQDAELVKLWQERVGLMRELVSVHVTRARYVG